jgi:hypothetical protein
MRPVEVTDSQIIEAARQLMAEGKAVTKNSLRNRVGAGNPRRIFAVWEQAVTVSTQPGNGEQSHIPDPVVATPLQATLNSQSGVALENKVQEMMAELAEAKRIAAQESHRVAELELVVNAVTDQLHDYKQRCVSYETSAKHTQIRIADLTARIDEQRGELHRGAQARNALEQALKALQSTSPAASK